MENPFEDIAYQMNQRILEVNISIAPKLVLVSSVLGAWAQLDM